MLKDDAFTFYCVWLAIQIVHLVAPVSIAITVLRFYGEERFRASRAIEHIALAETLFYFGFYLPRRFVLDSLPPAFTDRTREERSHLFHKCIGCVPDVEQWLSIWFKESDSTSLRADDVKLFLAWGFLNKECVEEQDLEELGEYLGEIEYILGRRFAPGTSNVQPCRVSTDVMCMQHKSLICYAFTVSIFDTACHILLNYMGMTHFRLRHPSATSVYPFRPLAAFSRHVSPSPKISYWYRAHTSTSHLPVLFIHGIGIGLQMHTLFLQDLIKTADSSCHDGQIGIIALEIMPISGRITNVLPPWDQMMQQIHLILDHHDWTNFVTVAHSFGSIFATHLLRSMIPRRPFTHQSLVLVDPVTLSIHLAEIPYNFIYRKPKTAGQLLCSFAATDIGVCPSIMRQFDWTQNVLWLDEIRDLPVVVFLAGKDAIIDTEKLRRFLQKKSFRDKTQELLKSDSGVDVSDGALITRRHKHEIVFHGDLNHGEIFLRSRGREDLVSEILERSKSDS